jgi:hypothetical protein
MVTGVYTQNPVARAFIRRITCMLLAPYNQL